MSQMELHQMAELALQDIGAVCSKISSETAETMCAEILAAKRIACYGVGREGLMIKALCMRLMHLGVDAHQERLGARAKLTQQDGLVLDDGHDPFDQRGARPGRAEHDCDQEGQAIPSLHRARSSTPEVGLAGSGLPPHAGLPT